MRSGITWDSPVGHSGSCAFGGFDDRHRLRFPGHQHPVRIFTWSEACCGSCSCPGSVDHGSQTLAWPEACNACLRGGLCSARLFYRLATSGCNCGWRVVRMDIFAGESGIGRIHTHRKGFALRLVRLVQHRPLQKGFWPMAHEIRVDYCMWLGAIFLFITGAGPVSLNASLAKRLDQNQPKKE